MRVKLELANSADAQAIDDLLNLAYRGGKGWTTESAFVEGNRSVVSDVKLSIEASLFFVVKNQNEIVGCICLDQKDGDIYIGSFAVHPDHQSIGLGASILRAAERYAIDRLKPTRFIMLVVSVRTELIAFYTRLGYEQTGNTLEYPLHLNVGTPRCAGLTLVQLCKRCNTYFQ